MRRMRLREVREFVEQLAAGGGGGGAGVSFGVLTPTGEVQQVYADSNGRIYLSQDSGLAVDLLMPDPDPDHPGTAFSLRLDSIYALLFESIRGPSNESYNPPDGGLYPGGRGVVRIGDGLQVSLKPNPQDATKADLVIEIAPGIS